LNFFFFITIYYYYCYYYLVYLFIYYYYFRTAFVDSAEIDFPKDEFEQNSFLRRRRKDNLVKKRRGKVELWPDETIMDLQVAYFRFEI
jgi:hypothetical protein